MDSNRKRRGFMKGKLMPFYRAAKPTPTSVQYVTSKTMKPSQSSPSAASVGFLVHQDYVYTQPKPKVTFVIPDSAFDSLYGVAVDEAVDSKAASYISSVQERFKLERVSSERAPMKCQDFRS